MFVGGGLRPARHALNGNALSPIGQVRIFYDSQSPHNSQKCIKKYLDNTSTLCISPRGQQKYPHLPAEILFAAIVNPFRTFSILHSLAAILHIHIVSPHLTNTIRSHYWNVKNLHNSYTKRAALFGKVFHVQRAHGLASPNQQTRKRSVTMGKRKTVIVIDTETAPIAPMGDKVDAKRMRVYDMGYIVRDKYTGEVYAEHSFVCADTFFNGRRFMDSAYYADKLPQYYAGIATGGEWAPVAFADAYKAFHADCRAFGVREVWAYNARFDRDALNATCKDISAGMVEEFINLRWRDIWPLAQCITGTNRYGEWATSHGYVSAAGIPKTSVEAVIKYLNNTDDFSERHTALDDAKHESDILTICLARGVKQPEKMGHGYSAAMRWAKQTGHYIPKEQR